MKTQINNNEISFFSKLGSKKDKKYIRNLQKHINNAMLSGCELKVFTIACCIALN